MKKLLSVLLVVMMMFSLSVVASAEETAAPEYPVVPLVQNAPAVDGEKDAIYNHALVVELDTVVDFPVGKPGTIPDGFSVKMSLVYDDADYIYMFFEVKDPTPVSSNNAVASDDSIRLFWYNDMNNVPASAIWWGTKSTDNNHFSTLFVESVVKTAADGKSWVLELAMPIYRFDKPVFDLGCMVGEDALPGIQIAPHYFNCTEGAGCVVSVSNGFSNLVDFRGTDSYNPKEVVPYYLLSETMIDNDGNPVAEETTTEAPETTEPADTDTDNDETTTKKEENKPATTTKADDATPEKKDGGNMLWIIAVVAGVVVVAIVVVLLATKKKKK